MKSEQGFTLIEGMISLIVISIGLLAIGSFTVSVLRADANAKARTIATHIAEQMIEEWSASDELATFGVTVPATPTDLTTMNTSDSVSYTPSDINLSFTLTASVSRMVADLPDGVSIVTAPTPPRDGGLAAPGMFDSATITPVEKKVTVAWENGGKTYSVYLTHATVRQ